MPGACQAEWIDDRIFAFIEKGYSIQIISATCCFTHTHPSIRHIKCPALSPHGARYEYEEIQGRKIPVNKGIAYGYTWLMTGLDKILNKLSIRSGEGRWSWFLSSVAAGLSTNNLRGIDFIFTTGGPASAHLSGILFGKLFGKKVISEFQDPLSGEDIGRNRLSQIGLQFFEKRIIRFADHTIYCTYNAMKEAKRRFPAYQNKIDYVYPGSRAVELYEQQASVVNQENKVQREINITYLGSLYQTRNLDSLMLAIQEIILETGQTPAIAIHLYGNMNTDIRQRILAFPYNGLISIHGLVSREMAMQKALEADVLLLIQNADERSVVTIPFKTYDYLHTGKLILALINKNDELENMMQTHGHLVCQVRDIQAIKLAIQKIVDHTDTIFTHIQKSELTPELAVKKMLAILDMPVNKIK